MSRGASYHTCVHCDQQSGASSDIQLLAYISRRCLLSYTTAVVRWYIDMYTIEGCYCFRFPYITLHVLYRQAYGEPHRLSSLLIPINSSSTTTTHVHSHQ